MVIFGGNPEMRDYVVRRLEEFERLAIFSILREEGKQILANENEI